jgi:aminopeptidase N
MEYFIKTFGNYPYKKYSVVQTEFVQGGMEFPALVMISDDLEDMAYGEVIVHETAHQWWQTTVGNNEIEYGFLDEGLAEYSVVLFYENHQNYGVKREILVTSSEKTFKTFCTVYDKLFSKVDTSMLRSLDKFSSEYEYVNIAYVKPTIMYDNLRKTIGDEKFFSSLKNYYKTYYLKNSKPDYLVAEFEKQVKDTSGYFYSFFDGKAII